MGSPFALSIGLTIAAFPGERPIVIGGSEIKDFKPYQGKILQADVAAKTLTLTLKPGETAVLGYSFR